VEEVWVRIKGALDLKEIVTDEDLVIEAIPENLDLKEQTFIFNEKGGKHGIRENPI